MICPVCKRDLAPTLSICFACGAMMNDTVREELETKVTPVPTSARAPKISIPAPIAVPVVEALPVQPMPEPAKKAPLPKPAPARTHTSELRSKKTSPTLVGFQPKTLKVPEWRLQLQNSVRQRNAGSKNGDSSVDAVASGYKKQLVTSGANALKADYVEEAGPAKHANPKVAKALERIEESRRAFQPADAPTPVVSPASPARNYPFNVVSRSSDTPTKANEPKPSLNASPKPRLVSSLRIEKKKFDTNKLPPLPEPAKISTSLDVSEKEIKAEPVGTPVEEIKKPLIVEDQEPAVEIVENEVEAVEEIEEIDDLAPIPHRFNAALFDLIVGGFAGLIVLSPFMISGGNWFSVSGVLAIAAATAVVTFIYLTVAIGFVGRTIGMRLFSLELIDAEENQYPSLHQAAVHSSLFILSLTFAGVGFLPIFFNEERRAAHDLLSGTILVREF